jgi:hypothetical protein
MGTMTEEEKLAEAKAKADAEANKNNPKTWEDSEVQKIIKQRQEGKEEREKLAKELDAFKEKERKELEAKQIEDGKSKELLTQKEKELQEKDKALAEQKKVLDEIEAERKTQKESLINKLTDETDKKVAVEIKDLSTLTAFVEKQTKTKVTPYSKASSSERGKDEPKSLAEVLERGRASLI